MWGAGVTGAFLNSFLGEELAVPEKLGLAAKVLQNLSGSAEPLFHKLFYYVKRCAEPSCRTPKVLRKFGEALVGNGKRGHYERGLFTGEISRKKFIALKMAEHHKFLCVLGHGVD